jgi:hypothetical protein
LLVLPSIGGRNVGAVVTSEQEEMDMRFAQWVVGAGAALALTAVSAAQGFNFEQVRDDFFAGISGDAAAIQRGVAHAKAALDTDPTNAQALVVHGFGTVIGAATELQKGNTAALAGMQDGFSQMDEAVRLAPQDGLVRALRGIMMQQATRQMPDAARMPMLEKGRADFEFLFQVQQAELGQLGTHRLGELLQGLGDINARLGRPADAQRHYLLIKTMLPATEYARRADEWLQTRQPLPAEKTQCIGCHVASH